MKIIHPSGESYDIDPGTNLEMSRTNPFFNEYGEQSLPITLPPSSKNLKLTGYPSDLSAVNKHNQRINTTIQEGIFNIKSRQAILSANRKEGIKTTFYLNEGAFFERLKEVQLSEIFKDKVLPFSSVDAAVKFVHSLMVTYDERFACFPVMADNELGDGYIYLNKIDFTRQNNGYYNLYNDVARTEIVDDKKITLSPGFYISPFIRAKYLLKEIFSFIGYTLKDDSLLTSTEPFRSMVFLNNNIDAIVKNEIRYTQLIPDCMASTILNLFRNKFCCEFIPDETERTVSIVLFDEILDTKPERDLTTSIVSDFDVNYPASFRQLKLSSEKMDTYLDVNKGSKNVRAKTDTKYSTESFDSLKDFLEKYPDVELDKVDGRLFRIGFRGFTKMTEYLGSINCNYYAGGNLQTESKESPDLFIEMRYAPDFYDSLNRVRPGFIYPYIGKTRALNSTILYDNTTENESTNEDLNKDSESVDQLKPILSFVSHNPVRKYDIGTIYNHDQNGIKLWDYTLSYNGEGGLFEKFWRKYDTLLRNSLLEVGVEQLLSESDKLSLSSCQKVIIQNQELLPNIIKYMPGKRVPMECTYLTTKLYEPVSLATNEADRLHPSEYYWIALYSRSHPDRKRFEFKEQPPLIYYAPPTQAQFTAGGKYHQKSYPATLYNPLSGGNRADVVDGSVSVWLVATKLY